MLNTSNLDIEKKTPHNGTLSTLQEGEAKFSQTKPIQFWPVVYMAIVKQFTEWEGEKQQNRKRLL